MRLFDLHCDTLLLGCHSKASIEESSGAVDLRRGRRYAAWTQAFAAWIPDGLSVEQSRAECRALLDTAVRWEAENAGFRIVHSQADLLDTAGDCRAVLTVENGGALAADREYLQGLYNRGVRLVTLTWNGDNHWGSGCLGSKGGALTDAGLRALEDLRTLHMTVDVSHLNETGFWQVAHHCKVPFVATHSNAAAVFAHPRNLTDDQFRCIRDAGGIVGINAYPAHLGGSDMYAFQRHLEHFLSLGGERCVCFGADFDGMTAPPEWDGMSVMEQVWQHLTNEGYSPSLLDAVFYKNGLSFFRQALDHAN